MSISKTRDKLVDVARQVFAKHGVEYTTMNDIAEASQKGRRTLYTYFKSKEEIYWAVVESELAMMSDEMRRVTEKRMKPQDKLLELIFTRLDVIKRVVYRNGTLRAEFFRDIWAVETCRKEFDRNQIILFQDILLEGQEKGAFHLDDIRMTAEIIHYAIKGLEIPFIRGRIGAGIPHDQSRKYVENIVFGALGVK